MLVTGGVTAILLIFTIVAPYISFAGPNNTIVGFFDTPAVHWTLIGLFGAFFVVQTIALWTTKFSIRRIGFFVFHIGMLLLLVGCMLYACFGYSFPAMLNEGNDRYVSFPRENGIEENLGFDIQVRDFRLEYYESNKNSERAVKMYAAELALTPTASPNTATKILYPNGPVYFGGYKIFLMGYSVLPATAEIPATTRVQVQVKKDPGEAISLFGISAMIVGAFVMAFMPQGKKRKNEIIDINGKEGGTDILQSFKQLFGKIFKRKA